MAGSAGDVLREIALQDRVIDLVRGVIRGAGSDQQLTTKELQLLRHLASRPAEVVSREDLLREVWGYQPSVVSRAVDNMMKKLRAKVEADPARPVHLITVFGEGYRFEAASSQPSPPLPAQPASSLTPPRRMFGRGPVITKMQQMLAEGRRALLVLGPAGMGKSTVARALAASEGALRAGGAWWCSPGSADAASLRRAVASSIGSTEGGLRAALEANGPMLIVLDGIDACAPDAESVVEELLAYNPALDILATSRVRMWPSLAVIDLPPLSDADASAMLEESASRVRPGRPLSAAERASLLERLEGWPLAIELAAVRLRAMTPAEIVDHLDRSIHILRDPALGGSLEAALSASLSALSAADRELFAACAVFRGSFSATDAELVCAEGDTEGEVIDGLHRLVDRSLLRADDSGQLSLLDPVRALAGRLLSEQGRAEAIAPRYLSRCLAIAERATRPPVSAHREQVRVAWDDLLAAHAITVQKSPNDAARIVLALQWELSRQGHTAHRAQLLKRTLDAGPEPALSLRVRMLWLDARSYAGEDTREELASALADAESLGDPEILANALLLRAQLIRRHKDPIEAERLCRRAVDLSSSLGQHILSAWGQISLGGAILDQGRFDEARQHFFAARVIAREAEDRSIEGQALWALGLIEVLRDQHARAIPHLEEALQRCTTEPRVRLDAHLVLAQTVLGLGDVARAKLLHDQIRPEILRYGDPEREAVLCSVAANVSVYERDWEKAERALRRHITLCERVPHQSIYAKANLGIFMWLSGRSPLAREILSSALAEAAASGAPYARAQIALALAPICAHLGEIDRADALLEGYAGADNGGIQIARAHIALARARIAPDPAPLVALASAIRTELAARPSVPFALRAEIRRLSEELLAIGAEPPSP